MNETLAGILVVGGAAMFCVTLIIGVTNPRPFNIIGNYRKLRQIEYLVSKGWTIQWDGCRDDLKAQAKDESKARWLHEAYERQMELDKIQRLNLPKESTDKYIEGSWK